jgi:hypothetical protein
MIYFYLMQTSTEIVLQLIISYKICSYNNKNKITWSTGLKKTIRMTKSPLTRHGILLQTPKRSPDRADFSLSRNISRLTLLQKPNQ